MQFKFNVIGMEELQRKVFTGLLVADDLRPAFLTILKDIRGVLWPKVFASEGGYIGSGWKPLNPDYAVWKEAHYPGMPILVASGNMRSTFLDGKRFGKQGGYVQMMGKDFLKVGSDYKVGAYTLPLIHQMGSRRGLPSRKIIGFSAREQELYPKLIAEYIRKTIAEGRGKI